MVAEGNAVRKNAVANSAYPNKAPVSRVGRGGQSTLPKESLWSSFPFALVPAVFTILYILVTLMKLRFSLKI